MAKKMAVTFKVDELECDQIDAWARIHDLSRSAALHELVMIGLKPAKQEKSGRSTVTFRFKDNYSYFWKGHDYAGFIDGDEAHIKFGGEWMRYDLKELPVEIVR